MTIRDADSRQLIEKAAEELKKTVKMPEWALYAKTGVSKERPPEDPDWWYVRSASVLRKAYIIGNVSVSKLRKEYGGRHRRGHKPAHFKKASGKIIRTIIQDLEKANYLTRPEKTKRGRILTKEGKELLKKASLLALK